MRPIERTVLGGDGGGGFVSEFEVEVVDDEGGEVGFGEPKSWANLTSFQMPTEELTTKVEAKVVMPAMAWSILG